MARHNDLGAKGEQFAKEFLISKGYEILDENWVHGKAEIDLITYKDARIVFVEVKTRSSTTFGLPQDFVKTSKQKLLAKAAEAYLAITAFEGEVRFDIISIVCTNSTYQINHIEDAFWPV